MLPSIPLGSCLLVIVSMWTIGLIAIVRFLDLAGGYGPVQYATADSGAMTVFNLRVITMFAMMVTPFLAAILACFQPAAINKSKKRIWRSVGLISYAIALVLLFGLQFFPTV